MQKMQVSKKTSAYGKESSEMSIRGEELIKSLNMLLANEFSLFTKTLNFHWNVTGKNFHSLHTLMGEQYKDLLQFMDDIAERVRVLGHHPLSTMKEAINVSTLTEIPGLVPSSDRMLRELLLDHREIEVLLKKVLSEKKLFIEDPSSEDFLVNLLSKHEKMSWVLRSHVMIETLNS